MEVVRRSATFTFKQEVLNSFTSTTAFQICRISAVDTVNECFTVYRFEAKYLKRNLQWLYATFSVIKSIQ